MLVLVNTTAGIKAFLACSQEDTPGGTGINDALT